MDEVLETYRVWMQQEWGTTKEKIHGLINYIDTKAKCFHLIKLTTKGTLQLAAGVYLSETSSTPIFLFRGGLAILYVLRYRVLNSCRIWSPSGLNSNTPHPLLATHCLYILYFDAGKGGGGGE